MSSSQHRDETFVNDAGEAFHLSVFPPRGPRASNGEDGDAPPVLFCVHGAGMSGDNFYRLASYLQQEGKAVPATPSMEVARLSPLPTQGAAAATTMPLPNPMSAVKPKLSPTPASSSPLPTPHPVPLPRVSARPTVPPSSTRAAPAAAMAGPAGDCAYASPPQPDAQGEAAAVAVVTFDLRCHGTSTFAGGEDHLTLDTLAEDFRAVLRFAKERLFPKSDFFVLGHSLGGSIVAKGLAAAEAQHRVAGVVLVDVVEGTAKLSLKYMHDFLQKRPASFSSLKDAETWFLRHGGMRTPEGAAVSVPPLLKEDPLTGRFIWRSNLFKMESVWDGWFDGLDKTFVGLPLPKMLCLANAERLDTELTVAQMQGKFQFEIIGNDCGHYVMDDATATLGLKIMRFIKRIETLTKQLKVGVKPGMPLHFNNATIPPGRQGV